MTSIGWAPGFQDGKYFLMRGVTEAQTYSSLGTSDVWSSSGRVAKAKVLQGGTVKWCGEIKLFGQSNSFYGQFGGVYGRREPNVVAKTGQWAIGDTINFVIDCNQGKHKCVKHILALVNLRPLLVVR